MGQHVLVPVDGSDPAKKAFDYVIDELVDPEITLINVINPVGALGYADEDHFDIEGYRQAEARQREMAEDLFEEFKERADGSDVDIDTEIRIGKPSRQILSFTEENDIDHIVMGSHGRTGAGRVLFGSVAEAVTRRSPVPVTIVR